MRIIWASLTILLSLLCNILMSQQSYRLDSSRFAIDFPASPDYSANIEDDGLTVHHFVSFDDNGTEYSFCYSDYPSPFVVNKQSYDFIASKAQSFFADKNVQPLEYKEIHSNGFLGFEYSGQSLTLGIVYRTYMVQNRLYTFFVAFDLAKHTGAESFQWFFSSFALH